MVEYSFFGCGSVALRALRIFLLIFGACASLQAAPDYAQVDAIFSTYCLDCHGSTEPESKLVLENYGDLMKGSENGAVVVPGKSAESLLTRMIEGTVEKEGKKLVMPPGKKRKKLVPAEIALVKAWIDAGAQGPAETNIVYKELQTPKIAPKGVPRNPVNSVAGSPHTKLIAVGRFREVELRSAETGALERTFSGLHGNVNSLAFSADGKLLFAGSGENAVFGEIKEWSVVDGRLIRTFQGHRDSVFSIAISPDGKLLASGSYDQKIKLWDVAGGQELKTFSGHNGCVFGLAFRPDGKILASASADHTVKLWDVAAGKRCDTLSQPTKDVYAVAFSPDGKRLVAGGTDNRIRIWEISPSAAETTNPLLDAKFAHEGAILRMVFSSDGTLLLSSADDGTVKLWDAAQITQRMALDHQSDWATGLDFALDGHEIVVGRLDGTVDIYDLAGKSVARAIDPPKQSAALSPK